MSRTTADAGTAFELEGAFGVYLAAGAVSAMLGANYLATELASEFLSPAAATGAFYGLDGLLVWVALQVATSAGVGAGGTYAYLRWTGRDLRVTVPAGEGTGRLLAGVAAAVAGIAVTAVVAGPAVGTPAEALLDRFGQTAAVTGLANPAPDAVVAAVVALTKVFVVAPAFGLVVHGVLQTTLRDAVSPAGGIVGVALLVVVARTPLAPGVVGRTPVVELAFVALALFAVAAAVGHAYDRTGSLAVPAAGYSWFLAVLAAVGAAL